MKWKPRSEWTSSSKTPTAVVGCIRGQKTASGFARTRRVAGAEFQSRSDIVWEPDEICRVVVFPTRLDDETKSDTITEGKVGTFCNIVYCQQKRRSRQNEKNGSKGQWPHK